MAESALSSKPNRAVSYVAADDRDGARDMVEHLLSLGRRRIGMVTGPLETPRGWGGRGRYPRVGAQAGLEGQDPRLVDGG
ncbi:hypothetical protein ACFWOX_18160, partial [Streptomyces sp. NPDC058467]